MRYAVHYVTGRNIAHYTYVKYKTRFDSRLFKVAVTYTDSIRRVLFTNEAPLVVILSSNSDIRKLCDETF